MSRDDRVSVAAHCMHVEPAGIRSRASVDADGRPPFRLVGVVPGEIDFGWTLSDG